MERKNICRRKFLSASAMSLFGYSLMVNAPASQAASKVAKSEIGEKIESALTGVKYDFTSEKNMRHVALECDVLVAGGGLAGVCAALAAARNGAKTVLVQDRSRLGGNASSEVKMHPLGVDSTRYGFREGGILEELLLENIANNPANSWEIWDLMLYDKCVSEPNLTLILDTFVYQAESENNKITCAYARSDKTLHIYKIVASAYIDCTGDSRLAQEAGAELMWGRDGKDKYGETEVVGEYPIGGLLCSSIMFTSRDCGRPVKFKAPDWAKKITEDDLKFRNPRSGGGFDYGYWFISHGGLADTIKDNEVIRFELISTVLGVWDYIKNCGKYPEVENRAIDTIGMIPGKRDSFRIRGVKLFKQFDIRGDWMKQPDSIGAVGWKLEDQPSGGFFDKKTPPAMPHKETPPFNISLSILISKDFSNLMMAGRNMSCSHLAFSCTRVMKTCAVAGQGAGTAAAVACAMKVAPSALLEDSAAIRRIQQTLLKDGQPIINVRSADPLDLARKAEISASASDGGTSPKNIINGEIFDWQGENRAKWLAAIDSKPWVRLDWKSPVKISSAILNLDAGNRFLTISLETGLVKKILYAPQPEILKDFDICAILPDGSKKTLAQIRANVQKIVRANFADTEASALQIDCLSTWGGANASIFELRAYGA